MYVCGSFLMFHFRTVLRSQVFSVGLQTYELGGGFGSGGVMHSCSQSVRFVPWLPATDSQRWALGLHS